MPVQSANGGGASDAFVAQINSAGSALVYSTYLGGSGDDFAQAVAVDPAGKAFAAGYTSSTDFPTVSPSQSANAGKEDAFVTEFSAAGSALLYSTYLGGSDSEQAYAVAIDAAGDVLVGGETASANLPMASPLQGAEAGRDDAFFTKVTLSAAAAAVPALGSKGPLLTALLLLGGAWALMGSCRRRAAMTVTSSV